MEETKLCPFWVSRVSGLATESPSALTLSDLLHCNIEDPSEVWTHVVLANYLIDLEWVFDMATCLQLSSCHVMIVSGEEGLAERYAASPLAGLLGKERVEIIKPKLPLPFGVHHGKLILCVNSKGVRISVLTANFIESDWGKKTQGIYVQDFPRLVTSSASSNSMGSLQALRRCRGTRFKEEIKRYLSCIGAISSTTGTNCIPLSLLDEVDYSGACVELVSSVPGCHRNSDAYRFGMGRLQEVLRAMQISSPSGENSPTLVWQFSSQGTLTSNFLRSLERVMTISTDNTPLPDTKSPTVRIIYPTEAEVKGSFEGWHGGLSLPVRLRCCHPYVNERLYRWGQRPYAEGADRGRNRAMPHIKTYMRLTENGDGLKWFMLTSANLSRAAWGEWQKGGTQILIRSYELGVVYGTDSFINPADGGLFSATPSKPIPVPSSIGGDGLVRVKIKTLPSESDRDEPTLFLPYNPLNPQPYVSTLQMQQRERRHTGHSCVSQLSSLDVPWLVDLPHRGKDCLGKEFRDVLEGSNRRGEEPDPLRPGGCCVGALGEKRTNRDA
ncbi:tyrosyl-DNA Phosphodiesterase (Tdp1), putative [Trypanosoma brucei gambiense DAL972]|uniref:Tyrosyl-DNA Phosphodiesterase (Tdp1), putative n=2 Tax=Trypanosoma brucei TaxID=5691 RepID=C9ZJR8_TRYB9|nr:tyrosyl-DNA Phosphodiesterase (Tdp1), putative [Trypanosoma brucei gambiense DAL972]RHW74108.1 tyrosyl-DNA Phosphodiesterase (Tdp1) [Trypanosoma brucei equiperdum]CBH09628.1 tyrosyl-DNA Phosphodiesterase (Tdp1), putative [Trypanosoma brucei gambiense DAL972]|eukprot:XP_011771932.1 tyrosyl-DNA Phosphodiesterase (Tdp1), putative [Trypanosoma brucei gambiense DAL972]